jgi:hypothetical protein
MFHPPVEVAPLDPDELFSEITPDHPELLFATRHYPLNFLRVVGDDPIHPLKAEKADIRPHHFDLIMSRATDKIIWIKWERRHSLTHFSIPPSENKMGGLFYFARPSIRGCPLYEESPM